MMRSLGLLFVVGALAMGCSSSTTVDTDTGGNGDSGSDTGAPIADTGVDAPSLVDAFSVDTGVDAASLVDAGTDAAPRGDAGMCVDGPPDPTRPTAGTCSACRPPGPGTGSGPGCSVDADCTDTTMGSNGRCVFGRIGSFCSYDACFVDGDCATDEVCLCDASNGGGNACVPANCQTNADCNSGGACSPTFGSCGHYSGFVAYRCHTAADTCQTDADCGVGYCAYDETLTHWACSTSECAG